MLRITACTPAPDAATLKLEGKLLGPWVAELRQACAATTVAPAQLSLDLSAVSYADSAGVSLLCALRRQGVRLAPCSGFLAALLPEECP